MAHAKTTAIYRYFSVKIRIISSAIALAIGAPAIAQNLNIQTPMLEEVIVTAQKRSQNLTDVPIAISAISAKALEDSGAKRLSDLTNLVPNVNISQSSELNSRVTIRGVGAQSRNIGFDTRVGVYLDGVYLGQSPALNQELGDLERVEVLRGPQGTLFGKNTVAGAINLITSAPSTDEMYGAATASFGNYDLQQVKGNLNIPLGDSVAMSIAANDMSRDGVTKNLYDGEYFGDRNVTNYRVQLLADVGDRLSARVAIDGMDSEQSQMGREALTDMLGLFPDTFAPERHEVDHNRPQDEEREIDGYALTLDYDMAQDFTLRSITSYRETNFFSTFDLDFGPYDYTYVDYSDEYEQTTQEFQLISPEYDRFNYVVGLYYYTQDAFTSRSVELASEVQDFLPILVPGEAVTSVGTVDTESWALFANGSVSLSDFWELTLGFRWSTEEKEVDWDLDGQAASFFVGTGTAQDTRRDTEFSPAVALNYFLNDATTLYGRVSTGYKSGGYNLDFNSQDTVDTGVEFDKETVISYEMGIKGDAFDRLQYTAALFRADYDDYQVNQLIELKGTDGLPSGTSYTIENAAKVETWGLELEGSVFLTENLVLKASAGYLNAEFDSFPGGGPNGEDLAGNALVRAPELSGSLALSYDTEIASFPVYGYIDYTYSDGVYVTEDNVKEHYLVDGSTVDFGYLPSYSLVNARIGAETADGMFGIAIWGSNLADEEYLYSSTSDFLGTIAQVANMPRTYGIDLIVNF
jgi:iron complex outermembrane recepter protein